MGEMVRDFAGPAAKSAYLMIVFFACRVLAAAPAIALAAPLLGDLASAGFQDVAAIAASHAAGLADLAPDADAGSDED